MRILIGTIEVGGLIAVYADGFRQLGHQVTTVIKEKHPFFTDIQYDVDISSEVLPWPQSNSQSSSPQIQSLRRNINRAGLLKRILPLIASHDVFIFLWAGTSLTERNQEFPLLKKLNKRIISIFCGSDVRHASGYVQLFAPLIADDIYVDWHQTREDFASDPLARPLRDMRMAERHSDLILSVPSQSTLAIRPYMHYFVPVKLSDYKAEIPGRDIPVVVHAPSDKAIKGTDSIIAALEQLKRDGVSFELRFMHGVPHQQVVSELTNADVVVDQLFGPLHGGLGVESMASACALATGNLEEYEPFPANRPIWHIDKRNIYEQLKPLLTNKELRIRLASEGRKYVETYHDHVQVNARVLEALNAGASLHYDHYPEFFVRNFQLPPGETIPEQLKQLTTKIIQRWGLPKNVDPQDIVKRDLMSGTGLKAPNQIPRWAGPAEINPATG